MHKALLVAVAILALVALPFVVSRGGSALHGSYVLAQDNTTDQETTTDQDNAYDQDQTDQNQTNQGVTTERQPAAVGAGPQAPPDQPSRGAYCAPGTARQTTTRRTYQTRTYRPRTSYRAAYGMGPSYRYTRHRTMPRAGLDFGWLSGAGAVLAAAGLALRRRGS